MAYYYKKTLLQNNVADCVLEVGDFVERDEEIATIETDKVG